MCAEGTSSAGSRLSARLAANLSRVRVRIARAEERAGRAPGTVRLLAVTKYAEAPAAAALAQLGVLDLGESRVQELERKTAWFDQRGLRARWHLIGHLQRNKARRAARLAEAVHSLDSARLLATLEAAAGAEGARPRVFFELRLTDAGEAGQRTGLLPAELPELLTRARDLVHLRPVGLMTMAPAPEAGECAPGADPLEHQAVARAVFARLAALRERLLETGAEVFEGGRIELSMGMSSDLEAAVAEGSDLVRVGSALFAGLPEARGRPGARGANAAGEAGAGAE